MRAAGCLSDEVTVELLRCRLFPESRSLHRIWGLFPWFPGVYSQHEQGLETERVSASALYWCNQTSDLELEKPFILHVEDT